MVRNLGDVNRRPIIISSETVLVSSLPQFSARVKNRKQKGNVYISECRTGLIQKMRVVQVRHRAWPWGWIPPVTMRVESTASE